MAPNVYYMSDEQVLPYLKNIDPSLVYELKKAVRGEVYLRSDSKFAQHAKLFNGAIRTPACLLVCPTDSKDISETIIFCNRHGLTPSIKSGGYGTHGLAVEGDVIIDMHHLRDVSISPENIPLQGSESAMDVSDSRTDLPPEYVDALNRFHSSTTDVYSPPDILKRKRSEAFQDDHDSPDDGSPAASAIAQPAPIRPSLSSNSPAHSSTGEQPADANGSHASASDAVSQDAAQRSNERRTRARLTAPESFPAPVDVILAGGARPAEQGPASVPMRRPDEEEPLASSNLGTSPSSGATPSSASFGLARLSGSGSVGGTESPLSSAAEDIKDTPPEVPNPTPLLVAAQPSVQPDAPPASAPRPRGPFDFPSTSQTSYSSAMQSLALDSRPAGSAPTGAVQPPHPFVYVTFGAGASQALVDAYTTANPFQGRSSGGATADVPYYVPFAAHPVGSATMLLGGFGFQTRLRGYSVDALVEVEIVLADGRIVVVNEKEHPGKGVNKPHGLHLWWAIRGAGPAFGVVTRYRAKAYPIPVVFAGNIIYDFNRATATSLIRHFRDCIKAAPRELYANVILTAGPRQNGALVVIQICWLGTKDGGIPILNAITSWAGGQCHLNEVNEKTFADQQGSVAKVLKGAQGRKWFLRSDVVTSLTDELIHETVQRFADTPDGCAWLFELGGGALTDFEDTCIPKPIRQGSFNIVAFHQWKIEDIDIRCVESAEEWMAEHVNRVSSGGPLPSFFERRELVSRTIGTYGEANWDRLTVIKRKYDPNGMMRHNFWPLEDDGRPLGLDIKNTLGESSSAERADGDDSAPPPLTSGRAKGKGKLDRRHGNHFMDKLLLP
ncbi:hypothetical protein FRB99_002833 [Tulasnella sp. 403]|nr:hypothetical protein FRB99_002833 [Tulasnella sp. 403]